MKKSQVLMMCGVIGYVICLVADFILDMLPKGHLNSEALTNYDTIVNVLENEGVGRFNLSAILGVSSMLLIALGMIGIYELFKTYVPKTSYVMLVSGVGAAVFGAVYHIICTTCAWMFIKMGKSKEAFDIIQEFITDNTFLMSFNAVLYTIMSVAFLIVVVMKKTPLPRWMCVFNVVFIYFLLSAFKIPGSTSIGGIVMCGVLLVYSFKIKNE